jgi:hypothetical protein
VQRFEFDNDSEKWVSIKGDPIIPDDVDGDTFWEVAEVAIEMYIFSQTYDIPRLRQDAMDRLVWCHDVGYDVDYFDTFVSAFCIKRAYDHTEEGSPLRKWLIIGFMEFCSYDKTEMNDYPHQYLIDISNNYKLLELAEKETRHAPCTLVSCVAEVASSMSMTVSKIGPTARSGSIWSARLRTENH